MIKGLIFDIEKYAIHDGPGIRTLVFFKGCPLNCLWCQNPESINPNPELSYKKSKCINCSKCSESCPEHAIIKNPRNFIKNKCKVQDGCRICSKACPSTALEIAGQEITVDELLTIILEDKEYYESSNGGVTCSGGEPTFQWSFVKKFLLACKSNGISTAIETCGYFNPQITEEIFEACDIVLFDLKHLDNKIHVKITGRQNEMILKNLENLISIFKDVDNKKIIIRMPLVPYNDSKQHLLRIEEFLIEKEIFSLVLLPYNSLYKQKLINFRLKRTKLKISSYSKEQLETIKNYFKNIEISIGG